MIKGARRLSWGLFNYLLAHLGITMAPIPAGTLRCTIPILGILCALGPLLRGVWPATIDEIDALVQGPLWNQTRITIRSGQLSGLNPPELIDLTNHTTLALSYNNFSGPIPPELGSLTRLTYLDISDNE